MAGSKTMCYAICELKKSDNSVIPFRFDGSLEEEALPEHTTVEGQADVKALSVINIGFQKDLASAPNIGTIGEAITGIASMLFKAGDPAIASLDAGLANVKQIGFLNSILETPVVVTDLLYQKNVRAVTEDTKDSRYQTQARLNRFVIGAAFLPANFTFGNIKVKALGIKYEHNGSAAMTL